MEYIKRQPEVKFPSKVCSRPVEQMDKKHLLRALTGNYGYYTIVQPSAMISSSSDNHQEAQDSTCQSQNGPGSEERQGSESPFPPMCAYSTFLDYQFPES